MGRKPRAEAQWKDRFTEQQLERKRQVDRAGQKRTRERFKHTVEQLQRRVDMLVESGHDTLVATLMQENQSLRQQLDDCRAKMELIFHHSRDFLNLVDGAGGGGSGSGADEDGGSSVADLVSTLDEASFPVLRAIIFRLPHAPSPHSPPPAQSKAAAEFGPDELVDAVMAWKLSSKHSLGFDFLAATAGICMPADAIRKQVARPSFHQTVASCFQTLGKYSSPFLDASPSAVREEAAEGEEAPGAQLPAMEIQRRAVVLCAAEMILPWRPLFRSRYELVAIFMGIHRLFTFLTFPAQQTLLKVPRWSWPLRSQLLEAHPGCIDFFTWPAQREYLVRNSDKYDLSRLCAALVKELEIGGFDRTSITEPLVASDDGASITIDPSFEAVVNDIDNFRLRPAFAKRFPDIASLTKNGWDDPLLACADPNSTLDPALTAVTANASETPQNDTINVGPQSTGTTTGNVVNSVAPEQPSQCPVSAPGSQPSFDFDLDGMEFIHDNLYSSVFFSPLPHGDNDPAFMAT